jgi:3-oxoacyl-[acyl-carrier-protein] synthase-1
LSPAPSDVVITGLGFVSVLGQTLSDVRDALRLGRSGVSVVQERVGLGFRSPLSGVLRGFDPKELPRKDRRAMSEPAAYAAVAALRAIADARLPLDALRGPHAGVILGNDASAVAAADVAGRTLTEGTTRNLGSAAVVQCMNSAPSINLSVLLGTQGAAWTVAAACASGAHAIGQAMGLLATGQQDVVICGGTQELGWAGMAGFDALGTFSLRSDDPAGASRPFSRDRDGLVPSGGSAVLVLERRDHAEARGARIRADLLAYAFSSDGTHVTTPSGAGAERAIRRALQIACLRPDEIEYINAHAASTPIGDRVEALALLSAFGGHTPPVSSTKSLTGHECWMAGASEVAYSVLMMNGGFIAPNLNFTAPDDDIVGVDVVTTTRDTTPRTILSNSFGFGGTNAVIALRGDRVDD